jgi:fructan beta-fructosidase
VDTHLETTGETRGHTPHLRPRAHFTPRSTWMNDPNGLVFFDGTYHMFFQNNPRGATWGNMSWGHATSTDLVTWSEHPVALPHTDEEHIFSGSIVVDHHNTAGFAGPGETALVAIYTSHYTRASPLHGRQAQSLAYSLDGGQCWTTYSGNPVLDRGSGEFRDPKVFWWGGSDGYWVMVAVEAVERTVVLYSSRDLRTWTYLSEFGRSHAVEGVWECPDLFPLPVTGTGLWRWVLVVSLNPGGLAGGAGAQYFVGDFDGVRFTPERISETDDPTSFDWLDHGRDYYAAVSFDNVPDRRLMVGWANNWDYANQIPTAPWRSAMSLVREVDLVEDAAGRRRLRQRPVLSQEGLGVSVLNLEVPLTPGVVSEVRLTTEDGCDPWVLTVDGTTKTITADRTACGDVDFHPLFASRDTARLVGDGATAHLQVVVDASVIEVFAEAGLVTLTQQVFPRAPLTQHQVRTQHPTG